MSQAEVLLLVALGDAGRPLNDVELARAWRNVTPDEISDEDIAAAKRSAAANDWIERGTDGAWRLRPAGFTAIGRTSARTARRTNR